MQLCYNQGPVSALTMLEHGVIHQCQRGVQTVLSSSLWTARRWGCQGGGRGGRPAHRQHAQHGVSPEQQHVEPRGGELCHHGGARRRTSLRLASIEDPSSKSSGRRKFWCTWWTEDTT